MSDYMRITWAEVRPGDVLMHENGDRLTVLRLEGVLIRTAAGIYTPSRYWDSGFTPHRKRPELPAKSGAYHDRYGQVWELDTHGLWRFRKVRYSPEVAEKNAPFIRLVPMPTREQVLEAVRYKTTAGDTTDAVMALLRGGDDD